MEGDLCVEQQGYSIIYLYFLSGNLEELVVSPVRKLKLKGLLGVVQLFSGSSGVQSHE